jgi:hypothetical protein
VKSDTPKPKGISRTEEIRQSDGYLSARMLADCPELSHVLVIFDVIAIINRRIEHSSVVAEEER